MKYRLKPFIFSKGKYVFWEYYLKDLQRGWENPHGVTFERFNEADLQSLEKTLQKMNAKELFFDLDDVKKRLEDGHRFYVAKKDGDIIGFFWIATRFIRVPFFDATIYLNDKECLSLNALIMYDYRGRGIFNRLKAYAFHDLKNEGFQRVIGFYWHRNRASIRMNERFGTHLIGEVKHITLLSLAFRRQTFSSNKIVFHGGPLLYWKRLARKLVTQFSGISR